MWRSLLTRILKCVNVLLSPLELLTRGFREHGLKAEYFHLKFLTVVPIELILMTSVVIPIAFDG